MRLYTLRLRIKIRKIAAAGDARDECACNRLLFLREIEM